MRANEGGSRMWRALVAGIFALIVGLPGSVVAAKPSLAGPRQKVLVFLRNPVQANRAIERSIGTLMTNLGATRVEAFHLISVLSATMTTGAIEQLRLDPNVAAVQPDRYRLYSLENGPKLADEIAAVRASRSSSTKGSAASAAYPPTSGPGTAPCPTLAQATPGSPLFSKLCTHEANDITHATEANAAGYDGTGVTVADIDTGFDITHPNLNTRITGAGLTFKDQANFNETTPGAAGFNTITDFVGHGTATASQIMAQGRIIPGVNPLCVVANTKAPASAPILDPSGTSNYCIYFKGMAPGVTLIPIEGLGAIPDNLLVGGTDGGIVRAVQWAVDHGADLINESFGGVTPFVDAFDSLGLANSAAVAHGVAVFGAMGNDGPGAGTITDTALNPDVIGVGAESLYRAFYDENFVSAQPNGFVSQNVKDWTSRAPGLELSAKPDLVAPGAFGWANFPMATAAAPLGEGAILGSFGGTSQATPVAVGNAALVIQAYKQKFGVRPTPQTLKSILMATATDLGYSSEYQGAGGINSMRAIEAIKAMAPAIRANPVSLALIGSPGEVENSSLKLVNMSDAAQTVHLAPTHEVSLGSITGQGVMTSKTKADATGRASLQLAPNGTLIPEINAANFGIPPAIAALHPELMRVHIAYYDPTGCIALRVRAYNNKGQWVGYGQGAADAAPFGQDPGRQPSETLAVGHYTELTWNLSKSAPTVTGSNSPEGVASAPFQILVYARNSAQAPGGINDGCQKENFVQSNVTGGTVKNPASLPIHWRVEWTKRAAWNALKMPTAITLGPKSSATIPVAATFPDTGSGTAYGNIAVKTAGNVAQVPVQLRIKVAVIGGVGRFTGALTGSEKEYTGGEAYYYQFDVPAGTPTIDAWVSWHDDHNQIFTYLISPDNQIEVSKYSSLPNNSPLIAGNDTHGVHMTQAVPRPGLWTVLVYGYRFYSGSLAEPYSGVIRLGSVTPANLVATALAGQTVTLQIPVSNGGGADFFVQALGERSGFTKKKLAGISGRLPNPAYLVSNQAIAQFVQGTFVVPPDAQSITATVTSSGDPVDLDLAAPDMTYWNAQITRRSSDNAGSTGFASLGSTVSMSYANPSRGSWLYNIGYANPNDFGLSTISGEVDGVVPNAWDWVKPQVSAQETQPTNCSGSTSSGAFDAHCGGSQTFSDAARIGRGKKSTLKVSVKVPAGTKAGDYTGTVVLYTVDGDLIARIPTTICVARSCTPSVLGLKTTRSTPGSQLPATGVGDPWGLGLAALVVAFASRRWVRRSA